MSTETVRHFVEALERGDLDAALRCVDERLYFVSAAGADFRDREGFRRWWELQLSSGADLKLLRIEALDDNHVFAELLSGHPEREGNTWAAETLGCVYTVDEGTIAAIEMFGDVEQAREGARRAIEVLRLDGLPQRN